MYYTLEERGECEIVVDVSNRTGLAEISDLRYTYSTCMNLQNFNFLLRCEGNINRPNNNQMNI